jgi:cysteine desulfurase
LRAIGRPDELAQSSLRLTLGRDNTASEIEHVLATLQSIVERLRNLAPAGRV